MQLSMIPVCIVSLKRYKFALMFQITMYSYELRLTFIKEFVTHHGNDTHVEEVRLVDSSQQTQNICITFVQCWTNVEDIEPTSYRCYSKVLCLLDLECKIHFLHYLHSKCFV